MLAWHRENPATGARTWQRIQDKWDTEDACPDGALRPFNIDARLNGAYIALGLLYGNGDFASTLEVTTRAGQDSDCNPSNAAGILGVMLGLHRRSRTSGSPGFRALAGRKFAFTNYSFNDIVASTLSARNGGAPGRRGGGRRWSDDSAAGAVPPALEQWDMGIPDRLVEVDDASWHGGARGRRRRAGRDGRPERGRGPRRGAPRRR